MSLRELAGVEVRESAFVPAGMVLRAMGVWWVAPRNRFGERTGVDALLPRALWTRHMLGWHEAARDQRRRARARKARR